MVVCYPKNVAQIRPCIAGYRRVCTFPPPPVAQKVPSAKKCADRIATVDHLAVSGRRRDLGTDGLVDQAVSDRDPS